MSEDRIKKIVDELCGKTSLSEISFGKHFEKHSANPMPSIDDLKEIIALIRSVIFPGYYGSPDLTTTSQHFYVGATLNTVEKKLNEQILRGHCFFCEDDDCVDCAHKSADVASKFMEKLPRIRHLLSTDAAAAYEGDPAARGESETVFCYPNIRSLMSHRVAHELHKLGVPLIPRIISEMAHSETGIDIHPGAQIGEKFFMDHGTGIVIGETTIIGKNVRLYQGVTLGAKSFPLDNDGHPVKGVLRHPIVEDDVIIYAGATILGRVTIGKGSTIGGNVWVTESVPAGSKVVQHQ